MELGPLLPPVTVNGVTLDPALIAAEAQNHPAPRGKPGHAWRAAARALAIRELLLHEARARDIAPEPAEIAPGQWETADEALIRQLLAEAIRPLPAPEAALRGLYDAHPDRFRGPSLYEAAHILIAVAAEDSAARVEARAQIRALADEVRRHPRGFAELAARHSACPSKATGGVLGQLSSGDTVPEFDAALATMEEGELRIVETRYGVHLVRLDARARGEVLPFDAVLPQLREAQEKAAWTRASHAFIAALIAVADIEGIELGAGART